ncbi:MAG: hypothetical protein Q7J12_04455 [Syntrophales bacterium]|nr:hypothetical protein [Syntrophales bacterium]
MITEAKDAATVILLRESPDSAGKGIEVLMVRRHPNNAFAPSRYVYPGGALDEDDYVSGIENFCNGLDQGKAQRLIDNISPPEKALGAWVAGIRETFEEVGLLLAYEKDGTLVSLEAEERAERFKSYRLLLNEGKIKLKEVLEKEGLTLATDRIHYFSHWVTPEPLPLRYDVRFFVSEAPENQEPSHDGFELVEHRWIKPQDALSEYKHQNFNLVLPTIMTLRELCRFKTVEEAVRSTEGKDITKILTKMAQKGDQSVEIMPDESFWGPPPL